MIRCLIIEDDLSAAQELQRLLALLPGVMVAGATGRFAAAQTLLATADYDVAFLDIELIGGSGFDLLPYVQPGARAIFTTAFDRFAVRAFEVNALDFLLKPVQLDRLTQSVRRLEERTSAPRAPGALNAADLVFLDTGQRARFTPIAEIAHISADDNYSWVTLASGERSLIRRPLERWVEMLPATVFVRVHRQHLVNRQHVVGYVRTHVVHVHLSVTGVVEHVPASRRLWPAVRALLGSREV